MEERPGMDKKFNSLFTAIENVIEKRLKNICYDKIGMITANKGNGYYEVKIDRQSYNIKNGIGVVFNPSDKCLVHYIYGDEKNKIIIAKL